MKYELLKNLYYKDQELYKTEFEKRYNSDCAFHLNIKINGNEAFFLRTPDIYEMIVKIVKTDSRLFDLYTHLPGVAITQYILKSLIGEIVGTNDIEHIYSSRSEINEILVSEKDIKSNKQFGDIVKRYMFLGREKSELKNCSDIRKIYDKLLYDEIKSEDKSNLPDGELFRRSQVNIHSVTDKIVHKGVYPESGIIKYMTKSLEFLNCDDVNILFRIAIFHYIFGYIHPFYDGNGRMSRFISSVLLYNNLNTKILAFRLSYTIKQNINEYYKAFKECNDPKNKGDLTPFVFMFFDIILKAMDNLEASLSDKKQKLDYYEKHLSKLPSASDKHMGNIYFYLVQASLFSENGISKETLMKEDNISRGSLDNCFHKIPDNILVIKRVGKTKFYSLDLERFEQIIHDNI